MDKDITQVIYRRFKSKNGEVIALFPEIPDNANWLNYCLSYQHLGQHGGAAVSIMQNTRAAHRHEYESLEKELGQIGYRLRTVMKFTRKHEEARRKAIEDIDNRKWSVLLLYPEYLAGKDFGTSTYYTFVTARTSVKAIQTAQEIAFEAQELTAHDKVNVDKEDFHPLLCVEGHLDNEA